MKSIRLFLVLVLVAVTIIVIFIATLRGYNQGLLRIDGLMDEQLQQQVDLLHALLDSNPVHLPNTEEASESEYYSEHAMYQILREDGSILARSVNSPNTAMSKMVPGYSTINHARYRWRVLASPHEGLWIEVAERDDTRFAIAENIVINALGPIIIGLVVLTALTVAIVVFALRPIAQFSALLKVKEATDLSPLPPDNIPVELMELRDSTNQLLARLQAAFEREKRFASDAAHELRNPITALSLQTQNLLADNDSPSHELKQLSAAVSRLRSIVEQVLVLSRTTPDKYSATFELIELHTLSQNVLADLYLAANAKNIQLELAGNSVAIQGDAFGVRTLIQNLVDNAIKYSPEHTCLQLITGLGQRGPFIQVNDSGPGIPDSDRARVFDRFYRLGGDRHQSDTHGSGLGLSIVKNIVELHRGTIELGPSPFESGLSVTVTFPKATDNA